jgi:hypothetical protein
MFIDIDPHIVKVIQVANDHDFPTGGDIGVDILSDNGCLGFPLSAPTRVGRIRQEMQSNHDNMYASDREFGDIVFGDALVSSGVASAFGIGDGIGEMDFGSLEVDKGVDMCYNPNVLSGGAVGSGNEIGTIVIIHVGDEFV